MDNSIVDENKINHAERERLNNIGHDIIGASFEVRKNAGRYFREKYYQHALAHELKKLGHMVEMEVALPAFYKDIEIEGSYSMDLLVDGCVIIETKATYQVGEREYRQLMSYLKLSRIKLGYLINFGVEDFLIARNAFKFNPCWGIYRFVNNF